MAKKKKSIWASREEREAFDRRAMANARRLRELAARGLTPEQRRECGLEDLQLPRDPGGAEPQP